MALYTLSNENWSAQIDSRGCELVSMRCRADGREYIWQAEPSVWKRHAPVLFPLVGRYSKDTVGYQGKTYAMTQHGFARDMEFEPVQVTDTAVRMRLSSTAATKERYPFDFVLICGYELKGNCLEATWRVENPGRETMYFAIGGHPAFVSDGRESLAGCRLAFDNEGSALTYHLLNEEGLWMPKEHFLQLDEAHGAAIADDMFDRDALIVEKRQAGTVTLMEGDQKIVEVRFDAPLFGLWSAAGKHVPYVCIEPWYGRTDAADFAGELGERAYDNALPVGEVFEASYEMLFYSRGQ